MQAYTSNEKSMTAFKWPKLRSDGVDQYNCLRQGCWLAPWFYTQINNNNIYYLFSW